MSRDLAPPVSLDDLFGPVGGKAPRRMRRRRLTIPESDVLSEINNAKNQKET